MSWILAVERMKFEALYRGQGHDYSGHHPRPHRVWCQELKLYSSYYQISQTLSGFDMSNLGRNPTEKDFAWRIRVHEFLV